MDQLIFYKNTFINKEIAFILNIPYQYTDTLERNDPEKKLFVSEKKDQKKLEKMNYKASIDFYTIDNLYDYLEQFSRKYETHNRTEFYRDLESINMIPNYLLSLPEMLIKVLYSKPKDIECTILEREANIDIYGNVWGCCPTWISKSFGNVFYEDDFYNNYYARMVKLSSINKTFCFCNLNMCKYFERDYKKLSTKDIQLNSLEVPEQLTLSIDRTCNLRCNSCRREFYRPSEEEKQESLLISNILKEKGWLNKSCLLIGGQGEAFFSPTYLKILKDDEIFGKTIKIMSNGILFTKEMWNLLERKYKEIYVAISIDAASKETYLKLRHGNFDILMKNLEMLGELRKQGKIVSYQFNYVIQKDNIHEVLDFIHLAKRLHVDILQFTKLNDWSTTSKEEYNENSLLDGDCLSYELYTLLQDPLFQDEMVNIESFDTYMKNSNKKYKNGEANE